MEKREILLIDTTLRDGEQAPGVVFNLDEKMRIALLLDELGIKEIEVGTPAMGKQEISEIKAISEAGFLFKTQAWCRAVRDDIDAAVKSGANGVNISFPVSDILLKSLRKDTRWVMAELKNLVRYAAGKFEYIAIGAQDASRARLPFLLHFIQEASALGVNRVRIADTVGILNPLTTSELFRQIRESYPEGSLEFHGHNDLGMATANTFMALACGADAASVTVNGLGERAGNAALEELVMALEISSDLVHGMNTRIINKLSLEVSKASGVAIPAHKPLTGSKVFSHESGIHASCLLKDRSTYQLVNPAQIGRAEGEFIFGKHSGSTVVQAFLGSQGICLSKEECISFLTRIKEQACRFKRGLSQEEVLHLYIR